MGVENYVKKLREKPEKTRYKILFACIFLIMGFIIVVWLTITFFWKKDNVQADGTFLSPFSVFREDFKHFYETIKQK